MRCYVYEIGLCLVLLSACQAKIFLPPGSGAGPSLTSVSPSSGPVAGGLILNLYGIGFQPGMAVSVGGAACAPVQTLSTVWLTCPAPAHAAGTVDVGVTYPDGFSVTLPSAFTYVPPPTLSSLAPTSGPVTGGTSVTLTGTGFLPGASVSLGGVACGSVSWVSSTSLTCVTGAHPAGQVGATITNSDNQSGTLTNAFGYGGDDVWYATTTTGAPAARYGDNWHDDGGSVWTGSKMIVWGEFDNSVTYNNTGGLYDPVADNWTPTTMTGVPAARGSFSKIWTGSAMIIWGGIDNGGNSLSDGASYDPVADSWTAVSTVGAPSARDSHVAVWTGSKMIIWSGENAVSSTQTNTGTIYDLQTDSWSPMSTVNAPAARQDATAVWTGSEMLVWGGSSSSPDYPTGTAINTGGLYNPTTDTWRAMSLVGAPAGRYWQDGVWTGNLFLIWSGFDGAVTLNSGGLYDPATDTWSAISTTAAPAARHAGVTVWTGNRLLVWGGTKDYWVSYYGDGALYDPGADSWSPVSSGGAPATRGSVFFTWTGTQMIVWGGYNSGGGVNTGGRYTP